MEKVDLLACQECGYVGYPDEFIELEGFYNTKSDKFIHVCASCFMEIVHGADTSKDQWITTERGYKFNQFTDAQERINNQVLAGYCINDLKKLINKLQIHSDSIQGWQADLEKPNAEKCRIEKSMEEDLQLYYQTKKEFMKEVDLFLETIKNI